LGWLVNAAARSKYTLTSSSKLRIVVAALIAGFSDPLYQRYP
jgi:hypothetical protein